MEKEEGLDRSLNTAVDTTFPKLTVEDGNSETQLDNSQVAKVGGAVWGEIIETQGESSQLVNNNCRFTVWTALLKTMLIEMPVDEEHSTL